MEKKGNGVCQYEGCITKLNMYNKGKYCHVHQHTMTKKEVRNYLIGMTKGGYEPTPYKLHPMVPR